MMNTTTLDPEMRTWADDFIRQRVSEGFASKDEIIEWALDYFEDPPDFDALEAYVVQRTREALAAHCEAQKSWPQETDCDRLDFAFLVLQEEHGIVARQHFTCCQTDGHNDIWIEIREAQQRSPVAGYVFYHQQDTENAVQHGELFLAFGAVKEGDAAACEVGRRIVQVLQDADLSVEWSGSPCERPMVKLNWQKRQSSQK